MDVKCPTAEVEAIMGEPVPAKAGESADSYLLRLSADEFGLCYIRRREAGRVWLQKKESAQEIAQALEQSGVR